MANPSPGNSITLRVDAPSSFTATSELAAAVGAGNAVIIKPSESTSLSTLLLMEAFAALPAGVTAMAPGKAVHGRFLHRALRGVGHLRGIRLAAADALLRNTLGGFRGRRVGIVHLAILVDPAVDVRLRGDQCRQREGRGEQQER